MRKNRIICAVAAITVVVAVVAIVIALVTSSLERLDSEEIGLKYDPIGRDLSEDTDSDGLHAGDPGFEFVKFPSVFETMELENLECLNKDGVTIVLDVSFQYRVRRHRLHEVVMEFKNYNKHKTIVRFSARAGILAACSNHTTAQLQSDRLQFQTEVHQQLVSRIEQLNSEIADVQVPNIDRPDRYDRAVQEKERAREEIANEEIEREWYVVRAETSRRLSESDARVRLAKAESDARTIVIQAEKRAEGILAEYEQETQVYEELLSNQRLQFSTQGFLSYISMRTISSTNNPVYLALTGPAKTSYVND